MEKGEVQWLREKERASQKKEKMVLVGREGYREKKRACVIPLCRQGHFSALEMTALRADQDLGWRGRCHFKTAE